MKCGPSVIERWEVWMPTVVGSEPDRLVSEPFLTKEEALDQRNAVLDTFRRRHPSITVSVVHVRTTREILDEE